MTFLHGISERPRSSARRIARSGAHITFVGALLLATIACRTESPRTFGKPEQAIDELSKALAKNDSKEVEALFGPGSLEVIQSGDTVADQQDADRVVKLIAEGVSWEDLDDHTKVASFGRDPWPFPFPLVSENGKWRFDVKAGEDELHSRRVGRNEISTLATLHAYVDAQREYWRTRPMGAPPTFAQRLRSDEGAKNGLYWPNAEGEEMSPLGELVAQAEIEGYLLKEPAKAPDAGQPEGSDAGDDETSQAYHGYHYRILEGQGENASGGALDYVDGQGRMTSGFAAVAWPASYGNSGIMTFVVNQYGIVFQKDLGDDTEKLAQAITTYDPDDTWAPTGD